jgi:hypothetical protein
MKNDPSPVCLRCFEVELVPAGPSSPGIEFFDCPACQRRYALQPGRLLTFRWKHPISLVLYDKLFDVNPRGSARVLPGAPRQASGDPERLRRMIEEIQLELSHPTQQVRDILDNPQTEEQCRQFLREFVAKLRTELREEDDVSS